MTQFSAAASRQPVSSAPPWALSREEGILATVSPSWPPKDLSHPCWRCFGPSPPRNLLCSKVGPRALEMEADFGERQEDGAMSRLLLCAWARTNAAWRHSSLISCPSPGSPPIPVLSQTTAGPVCWGSSPAPHPPSPPQWVPTGEAHPAAPLRMWEDAPGGLEGMTGGWCPQFGERGALGELPQEPRGRRWLKAQCGSEDPRLGVPCGWEEGPPLSRGTSGAEASKFPFQMEAQRGGPATLVLRPEGRAPSRDPSTDPPVGQTWLLPGQKRPELECDHAFGDQSHPWVTTVGSSTPLPISPLSLQGRLLYRFISAFLLSHNALLGHFF